MSEQALVTPRVELVGAPSSAYRNAAVDYGEYFAIYQLGRSEYDRADHRRPELERMMASNPPFIRDTIKLLDEHLERAIELKKGFLTALAPSAEVDPAQTESSASRIFDEAQSTITIWQKRDLLNGLHRLANSSQRGVPSGVPPDYTFSSVRHPVARPLLDLLNIAMVVDDQTVDNPRLREERLRENGKKMVKELVGQGADPHRLMRIKEVDILAAVFAGVIRLPESPGKPLFPDEAIRVSADELPEE